MILTNGFEPDVRVYKEAKYLKENGYNIEILCWDRKCLSDVETLETIEGINIRRFKFKSIPGTGIKQIGSYLKFIFACKNYLNENKYDYLHCHDLDGIIVGKFANVKKRKLIFDMHEYYEGQVRKTSINKYLTKILVKYMHNISDKIIYINDTQIKNISIKNKKKLVFIPNYPVKENFSQTKIKSNKMRIGYAGNIRRYDILKILFDAVKENEHIEVSIYGEGNDYKKLKNIENNYTNVEINGKFNGIKDSRTIYENMDLQYAVYDNSVNNWKTSFPVKLFESIVSNTPVVVSKGTMIENFVIENDIGYVVEWNNFDNIKKVINSISKENKDFLTKKDNLKKLSSRYSWEDIVNNMKEIYRESDKQ